ncbi:MAG TPA: ascorbate-dependent monooxygenase [Verrucomicrobiae bacterium]|nr:ascorbate-dependent monooxygenase [Verrucomicrobiae bacterium]
MGSLVGIVAAFFFAPGAPTFSHDVAPLLYKRCANCHHAGGVAPFALLGYADAAKRARLIAQVAAKRYMPPWLPSEPRFQNEMKLTDAEIALLGRWAANGAPEGDAKEAPAPPQFADGWTLGKPDLEGAMPAEFAVPSEGLDLYQCFVIPAPSARDHWVRALDIRPGNARVVHHVILFQDTTRTARARDHGTGYPCFGTPGFLPALGLGGWTPGFLPARNPDDMPELLHGGADLVLQIHYHPTGKPETDRTRLALYFTDQPPKRRSQDIPLSSNRIDIPPGDRTYKVTDHFTIPVDVDAIAVIPHAHYVCRSMYGYAVLPDGTRRTLLRIPEWDFNWQQQYRYKEPVRLPEDTEVFMEFTYDNSEANPRNPNHPPARVRFGPGTTDEMAGLHIQVIPVRTEDAEELSQALWGKMMRALGGGVYRR